VPTGRGGGQPREWYRGIPIPQGAAQTFSRRNNTNYMQTGVLSALQLTAMFPNNVVENFYIKTRNSIADGMSKAPYGYVFPVQHDGSTNMISFRYRLKNVAMKVAEQSFTADGATFPAGSFVLSASDAAAARPAIEALGLRAAALSAAPSVTTHDADVPRVAIY